MKKRLLSFFVMASLLLTMLVMPAHAITADGTCGDNLTWHLGESGVLTISGTGPMEEPGSSTMPWNVYRTNIKHVWIENGVTSVADKAFMYYPNLTAVTLPASVTSVGNNSFAACPVLKTITANKENTAFTSADGVLFNKDKTTLICYPSGRDATSYTIPSTVTTVNAYAIYRNPYITRLTIPESVTTVGSYAFAYSTGITSLTIPGSIETTGYASFSGCSSLSYVLIKNGVQTISSATFNNCSTLATMVVPKSLKLLEQKAFTGCTSLTNVHYTGTEEEWSKITNRGNNNEFTNAIIRYNYGTYTVTYDANGGEGAPSVVRADSGTPISISTTIPTRDGYDFVEWNTKADGSGSSYAAGSSITSSSNVTLYAIWKKSVIYYTITFDANGGPSEWAPDSVTVAEGEEYTLPSVPDVEFYSFDGWSSYDNIYLPGDTITVTEDITLYAIGSELDRHVQVTVSYDANGGDYAPNADEVWILPGDGADHTISSEIPAREGYTFIEWNTQEDGSGDAYAPNSDIFVTENITLYAIWEANPVDVYYTVSYDANGGEGTPNSASVLDGTDHMISSTIPSRDGYRFVGWNTESNGLGLSYTSGDSITVTENITLYAIWEEIIDDVYYTVSYDANGGEGAPASVVVAENEEYTITELTPERSEHIFMGWNTKEDGSGELYQAYETITVTSDITLYAVWEKLITHVVSYDANGGEGAPESELILDGPYEISLITPSRTGDYIFKGWSTSVNNTDILYQPGDIITVTEDITLYAIWELIPVDIYYTITYDANGGENAPASETVAEGTDYTISFDTPSRDGYIFMGWNTLDDGSGILYQAGETITIEDDITLYAIWEEIIDDVYYTITYNVNGGEGAPEYDNVLEGTDYIISSAVPTKEGYTFISWRCLELEEIYYPGSTIPSVDRNLTLSATWFSVDPDPNPDPDPVTYYTLYFDSNGGEGAPNPGKIRSDENYIIPDITPTHESGIFEGWNTQPDGTGDYYRPGESIVLTDNTTLYAIWTIIPDVITYTITYDANGGEDAPASETVAEGADYTISFDTPSRDGYIFMGWNTLDDGSGILYQAGETITIEDDITLYAVWEEIIDDVYYTVAYDANDGEDAPASETVTAGTDYTISFDTPSRDGYIFMGWNTTEDGSGILYQAGDIITIEEDITLYAVWEKDDPTPIPTDATITLSNVKTLPGKQVQVTLSIKNNPGIISMLLRLDYDNEYLKLVSVDDIGILGDNMHSDKINSIPYVLSWASDIESANITTNGDAVVFTFEVSEDAPEGFYPINVSYNNDKHEILNFDLECVYFNVENGGITVRNYIVGDVNGDEQVTSIDRIILSRYLANWDGYGSDSLDLMAADVNADGKVTSIDRIILSRYLSDWEGYDSLPYTELN